MQLILFGYNLVPLLIIFTGSIFLTIGDIIAKMWVQTDRPVYFLATLGLYILGLICLILSFRYKNIAVASLILIILNVITLALYSWRVLGEPLSPKECMGLAMGFVAILLLE